ncbi:hypothetical protein H2199_005879 [Coniosporium tulheliwenetii]|uniref:Uncharacterized protein n=1 Tax=Coniosporium tulheliwenetii TaxID=3383036 RepID=A0ACC2YYD1_9PEZI|nr:hypothetical protein H2199_005879 [Cladosporium sp. JES 115]
MDFGAGGFSIAPVLSAVRVVDWEQSPAFAAVDAACDAVLQLYGARHGFDMYGKGYQDDVIIGWWMSREALVNACIKDPSLVNAAERSETDLRQLIASGHDVDAGYLVHYADALPLAPLFFALDWPAGLQILLEAGADLLVLEMYYAMEHASESAVVLLLAHGYPLFSTVHKSVLLTYRNLLWSANVLDAILERLAQDRRQLLALASGQLTFGEQEALGLTALKNSSRPLDNRAKSVVDALEEHGTDVPAKIWPGRQKTIFHLQDLTRRVVQKLFAAGFRDVDVKDEAGYNPLVLACWQREWDLVEWYSDHGADPRAIEEAGFVNPPRSKADALDYFIEFVSPDCVEAAHLDACRVETFERLGMAHTCCQWDTIYLDKNSSVVPYPVPMLHRPSEEEQRELQDEDAELKDVLEAYMCLYQDLQNEYSGQFLLFWNTWWEVVSDYLPGHYQGYSYYGFEFNEDENEDEDGDEDGGEDGDEGQEEQEQEDSESAADLEYSSDDEATLSEGSISRLGYEPDEEAVRARMRDLLPLGFREDPAEIFSDGIINLFDA